LDYVIWNIIAEIFGISRVYEDGKKKKIWRCRNKQQSPRDTSYTLRVLGFFGFHESQQEFEGSREMGGSLWLKGKTKMCGDKDKFYLTL